MWWVRRDDAIKLKFNSKISSLRQQMNCETQRLTCSLLPWQQQHNKMQTSKSLSDPIKIEFHRESLHTEVYIRSLIYDPTSSPDGFRMFRRKSFEFRGFPSSRISTRLLRLSFLLKIHFKRITKKKTVIYSFPQNCELNLCFVFFHPSPTPCRYLSSFHLSSSIHSQMRFSRRRKILFSVIEDLRRVQDEIIG